MGLRLEWLGTPALSWRDLWVVVRQSPDTSAVHRSLNPDEAPWGLAEHLAALVADRLAIANWQRGGGKGDYPSPLPRPGVEPETTTTATPGVTAERMEELLAARRAKTTTEGDS